MSHDNQYDVIIIGTGAGGGTLAYHLAPSGKRILILERGDYVAREKENWNPQAVNVDARYNTKEIWRDIQGRDLHPHTNYYVGGNTKFYGAALFRLRQQDFGEIRHHGGISPAWPIAYNDLEPYYSQAEQLYQVHGNRGEDPTEPPAGKPYTWPAVSHESRIQHLADDFASSGLTPFHTPLGIMLDEKNLRQSPCIRCNTCDGFPCLVQAKSDAQVLCVDPAVQHSNVTLLTNALVRRLETGVSGREVSRVVVERNGSLETYSGDLVVVSCGAINSAALLLRSANDKHPQGLANGSDVVGRHYMGHTNSVLMAISKCPNPTIFQKTLSVNDFYFGSRDFEYPMGHISFVDRSRLHSGIDGKTFTRFLADFGRPARSRESGHHRPQWRNCDGLHTQQFEGPRSAKSPSAENHEAEHLLNSRSGVPPGTVLAQFVCGSTHSTRRGGSSERYYPLRP